MQAKARRLRNNASGTGHMQSVLTSWFARRQASSLSDGQCASCQEKQRRLADEAKNRGGEKGRKPPW